MAQAQAQGVRVALPAGCTGAASAGPDVITCTDGVPAGQVINSRGGNDRITVTGRVAGRIDGGAGDDTIHITGKSEAVVVERDAVSGTVRGGAGDDTITATGGAGTGTGISGGFAVAQDGLVHGEEGRDTLTLAGGNGSPDAGVGAGGGIGVVGQARGGAGADHITVRGGNGGPGGEGGFGVFVGAVHGGDPGLASLLDAADGADTITVTGGNGGTGTSSGGSPVSGGAAGHAVARAVVSGGSYGDHITLTGGNGGNNTGSGTPGTAGAAVIDAGAVEGGDPGLGPLAREGDDAITLTGGNGGTSTTTAAPGGPGLAVSPIRPGGAVHGDRGNDRITITGGGAPTGEAGQAVAGYPGLKAEVEGNAGADHIALNTGEGTTTGVRAVFEADIEGGGQLLDGVIDGDDTITVGTEAHPDRGQTERTAFRGADGNDTITLHGTARDTGVYGEDGEDTCGKESTGATFDCETVNP
ncbi:hypothetical protein FH965_39650 [Streptomyces spectabilis]|uniref:Calcium-binding protein n=2 Tax=Streptomyces spectabilis TaxID=68270 RepID=A0A516RJU4_STRST|nr:hypothetical protein FH965_39650 [Streptomyces spectabilis]